MCRQMSLSSDLNQHLKYADNEDDADDTEDRDDYNRVIGIPKCEQKIANTHPNKCIHPSTDIRVGRLQ